jgi:hypothetical protein
VSLRFHTAMFPHRPPMSPRRYVIVPITTCAHQLSKFHLSVYFKKGCAEILPIAPEASGYAIDMMVKGQIVGESAGGCYPNEQTWWKNPQHLFTVEAAEGETVSFVAALHQTCAEGKITAQAELKAIGFVISKAGATDKYPQVHMKRDAKVHSSKLLSAPVVSSHMDLPAGQYYITPFAFEAGVEFFYDLRVMADSGISELKDAVPHTFIDHISGAWKGEELAGGCVNNQETWLKNPSFVMDVKEDTELSIVINQEGHSHAREAMGVALFKGSPPYLYNMAVNDNLWYQDSFTGKIEAGTYGVVAQTFAPGVEVPFSITVIGEAHIEFKDMVGTTIASGNEQKQ